MTTPARRLIGSVLLVTAALLLTSRPGGAHDALRLDSLQLAGHLNSTAVPEPGSLALFGIGLFGIAAALRRRRST